MDDIKNPADFVKDVYTKYSKGLSDAASTIADKVLQTTTPQGLPDREKFIKEQKPAVELGTELVGDPLNYIGAPLALAGVLAKAPKALKSANKIAGALKTAEKAPEAYKFAKEGFQVLNSGQPAIETALAKAARHPDMVKADIASRGSLNAEQKAAVQKYLAEQAQISENNAEKLAKIEARRIKVEPQQVKDMAHARFEAIKNSP